MQFPKYISKLRNYLFLQAQISNFLWLEYNRIQQNMCLLHYKSVNNYGWGTFSLSVYLNVNKPQMEKLNAAVNMHFSIISLFFYCPKFKKKKKKKQLWEWHWDLWPPQKDALACSALMTYKEAKFKNITQKYKPIKLRLVLYIGKEWRWQK